MEGKEGTEGGSVPCCCAARRCLATRNCRSQRQRSGALSFVHPSDDSEERGGTDMTGRLTRLAGQRGRAQRGLTMVELLVTIVISSLFLPAMVPVFVMASKSSSADRVRVEALNVAQSRIEAIRSLDYDNITPQSGCSRGGHQRDSRYPLRRCVEGGRERQRLLLDVPGRGCEWRSRDRSSAVQDRDCDRDAARSIDLGQGSACTPRECRRPCCSDGHLPPSLRAGCDGPGCTRTRSRLARKRSRPAHSRHV